MGIKERKERDKEEMRSRILQSALELFLDRNFQEISIRNIAEAIEYSPATIYLYFKGKNEIFHAVQMEALKAFNDYVATNTPCDSGFERLTHLVDKYVAFAFSRPQYYNIMFLTASSDSPVAHSEEIHEGNKTHAYLEKIIDCCKTEGYFKKLESKTISFMIWSYVHGVCSLALRNRMRIYPQERRELIRIDAIHQFMKLLKTIR